MEMKTLQLLQAQLMDWLLRQLKGMLGYRHYVRMKMLLLNGANLLS
jgi:hypothetical protein